ncbi:hypothetical protein BLNAU_17229 [Blattamonas nauphoetae]|uniref:Uncharacterized protein n=1 Tax=Blattamonas nauphoetae TaxID=2049346 RepID=A0ABQ9X7L0_9EUKA|nr:hypothetical protein BLNAU_17229 [Blattamonas nauphoetae]
MEMEGVLSSGIVERLCTRIEVESSDVDVLPTLLVLDRLCRGFRSHVDSEQHSKSKEDKFSLTRRCGFALARIEQGILTLEKAVGGKMDCDEKTQNIQKEVGGMIVRHFRSSNHSSKTEIGAIGIDLAAERREMEAEREKMRQSEEERQREFSRKMREMEDMKKMHEKWIEEGRQREEEKENEERKREEERKRQEEEERRRNVKEGIAAIEVFQQDEFALTGNVLTKISITIRHLLSHSFGAVVVRFTFIIRAINDSFHFGLISTALTEEIMKEQDLFISLRGGAGWNCYSDFCYLVQNKKASHNKSACKAGMIGQRVVMEADGREGIRTLKLSQDGETQPVFFSNIPVPFRFVIHPFWQENSVEIVSTEVLREPSMVGGNSKEWSGGLNCSRGFRIGQIAALQSPRLARALQQQRRRSAGRVDGDNEENLPSDRDGSCERNDREGGICLLDKEADIRLDLLLYKFRSALRNLADDAEVLD